MQELVNIGLRLGDRSILQGTNLAVAGNKIHVLMGPSGCGKSTILRLFAGLLAPQSGEIRGKNARASFVFQEPRLLDWLNVSENITLPFRLRAMLSATEEHSRLAAWLKNVGLTDAARAFPHELSGGMKMRAAIARALITEPELLLMDEPFAALDEVQRWHLQDLLLGIQSQKPMTVLFVTHSLAEAVRLSDVVHMMAPRGGKILQTLESPLRGRESRDDTAEERLRLEWTRIYQQLLKDHGAP